ncbi:hypothetical protein HY643_01165 [Candidatus Woesearchaeota archaeon]|nr:hypothetical protein [Candidatus Woesearchaeota archaeon]
MAFNVALKYSKGIILLSNTSISLNEEFGLEKRIFKLSNNAALAYSGCDGKAQRIVQQMQTLAANTWKGIDNYVHREEKKFIKLLNQNPEQAKDKFAELKGNGGEIEKIINKMPKEAKKMLFFPNKEAYINLEDPLTPIIEDGVVYEFGGKKILPLNNLVVQKFNANLIFDVESLASYTGQFMHDQTVSFLFAGCDLGGERIFKIFSGGAIKEAKSFTATGSHEDKLTAIINEYYQPKIKKGEALRLVLYAASRVAEGDRTLPNYFNLASIEFDEENVKQHYYTNEEIAKIKKEVEELKVQLFSAK